MLVPRSSEPKLSGVRRSVKRTLYNVGYYHRRLSQLQFPGVAVLCYHGIRAAGEDTPFRDLHVTEKTFESHCRLLAETCNPISVEDFLAARSGARALPVRPVIVTFDDGYRAVLDRALPVLERYRVPATVFTCVEPVLKSRHFWFDVLCRLEGEASVLRARSLPYGDWRVLAQSIDIAAHDFETHRPMTRGELQRLAESPLIEIGGHTLTHPTLARASVVEQRHEVGGCRDTLHDVVNKPIQAFAYPYGDVFHDFLPEAADVVRDTGFSLAFTTREAFATLNGDPFQIPRFMMLEGISDVELAHRLVHSWQPAEASA
jgi:peptidoglycan/xylan/chitin deacetylase (PgdA/CDA1 family)